MAWAAPLVLAWLVGATLAPSQSQPSEAAREQPRVEDATTTVDAPSTSEVVPDPWATVPLQTVAPRDASASGSRATEARATEARPADSRSADPYAVSVAPLMDPWANARRGYTPRHLDPELRDPFSGTRIGAEGPAAAAPARAARASSSGAGSRLAHAELRDPFSAHAGGSSGGASSTPAAGSSLGAPPRPPSPATPPSAEGTTRRMPPHAELRDPFANEPRAPRACTQAPCPPPLPSASR